MSISCLSSNQSFPGNPNVLHQPSLQPSLPAFWFSSTSICCHDIRQYSPVAMLILKWEKPFKSPCKLTVIQPNGCKVSYDWPKIINSLETLGKSAVLLLEISVSIRLVSVFLQQIHKSRLPSGPLCVHFITSSLTKCLWTSLYFFKCYRRQRWPPPTMLPFNFSSCAPCFFWCDLFAGLWWK